MELTAEARNPKFFGTGYINWNEGTSINISCTTHKKENHRRENSQIFLLLDIPKIAFQMRM